MRDATEERVTTVVARAGDVERLDDEDAEDDKCKDPLQRDDLDGELLESQGCSRISLFLMRTK